MRPLAPVFPVQLWKPAAVRFPARYLLPEYSPTWPDGTKHSKCVYAHTREECEEKLKVLIQQLNAERKAILDRLRGIPSPEKLTKKQRQIWEYMKIYPDETNYSTIAKGAKVTRHTVAKHFEMIQKILG